jgi:hypothetical protein
MNNQPLKVLRYPKNNVDYNLRTFRLLPDNFTDDEKLVLEPYEDNVILFVKLLGKIIEKKVIDKVGEMNVTKDEYIKECIMAIGFQHFYVDMLYKPFKSVIERGDTTYWKMLSLGEWINGWLENILFTLNKC